MHSEGLTMMMMLASALAAPCALRAARRFRPTGQCSPHFQQPLCSFFSTMPFILLPPDREAFSSSAAGRPRCGQRVWPVGARLGLGYQLAVISQRLAADAQQAPLAVRAFSRSP